MPNKHTVTVIKELELTNWKSFKNSKLYIDPLTIIIGTNASGKSNILDALLFLQKMASGKQISSAIDGDTETKGIRGGGAWVVSKDQTESEISVPIGADEDEKVEFIYKIRIGKTDHDRIEIKSESLTVKKMAKTKRLFGSSNDDDLTEPGIRVHFYNNKQGKGKGINMKRSFSVLSQSKYLKLTKEVAQAVDTVIDKLSNVFILDPIPSLMRGYTQLSENLLPDASNISGVIAGLESARKAEVENILTSYSKSFPETDISRIWTETAGKFQSDAMLYCAEKWNDREMMIDAKSMSDGTLRFLAIMTAILTIKENSLLGSGQNWLMGAADASVETSIYRVSAATLGRPRLYDCVHQLDTIN